MHNTDARRFLKHAEGPYDLVVFALLDSHTLFSAFSSVRLDNFVYTQDSFIEASKLLAPDGVLVVMFGTSRDFVGQRLFTMAHNVFLGETKAWSSDSAGWGRNFDVIVGGLGAEREDWLARSHFKDVSEHYLDSPARHVPSDNWPFLDFRPFFSRFCFVSLLGIDQYN